MSACILLKRRRYYYTWLSLVYLLHVIIEEHRKFLMQKCVDSFFFWKSRNVFGAHARMLLKNVITGIFKCNGYKIKILFCLQHSEHTHYMSRVKLNTSIQFPIV